MKVLLVGGGGREHALAWKLAQSSGLSRLYAAPGNPGMEKIAQLVPLKASDVDGIVAFAQQENIDLVFVGPEAPLALGLADRLGENNIPCFGPTLRGAVLESSKKFAKDFMARHDIPTAAYRTFSDGLEAKRYIESLSERPWVVKADGLAQGKGVVVAPTRKEASEAVDAMMEGRFGRAGQEIVIEECMTGEEVSLLAFSDGKTILPMLPVQDHKRIGEGDTGPNTGGMGTYAPVSVYTPEIAREINENIVLPLQKALREEGIDYRGCLYIGLMLTPAGVRVVEFNVRFGDPETQVLMPLLETDLLDIAHACAEGCLEERTLKWRDGKSVCVVMSSKGYPGDYSAGHPIREDAVPEDLAENSWIYHAGTARDAEGKLITAGGRVLGVTARADTLEEALKRAYARVESVHFEGAFFRRDIACRELNIHIKNRT